MDKCVDGRVRLLGYYPISSAQSSSVNFAEDNTEVGTVAIVLNSLFYDKRSTGMWTGIWEEERKGPVLRANRPRDRTMEKNKGKDNV